MQLPKGLLLGVLVGTVMITAAPSVEVYRHTSDTCLRCRAVRKRERVCGFRFESIEAADVSPQLIGTATNHQHEWRYCGSTQSTYLLGGWACGAGRRHPIWEFSPKAQLRYKGMATPDEYEATLNALESRDRNTAGAAVELVFNKVYSLPPNR